MPDTCTAPGDFPRAPHASLAPPATASCSQHCRAAPADPHVPIQHLTLLLLLLCDREGHTASLYGCQRSLASPLLPRGPTKQQSPGISTWASSRLHLQTLGIPIWAWVHLGPLTPVHICSAGAPLVQQLPLQQFPQSLSHLILASILQLSYVSATCALSYCRCHLAACDHADGLARPLHRSPQNRIPLHYFLGQSITVDASAFQSSLFYLLQELWSRIFDE
ncbi:hypothetical protein NDU88_007306 [Pleurodeles waltl]|uniref:Uncharacterized protein n=1 Tax=Pleurodeles waltl TaxID=8319 RepID=A0AAV7URX9_PLEWA|nr:hypothetical protein NDU88_007306 [Pleurodeles waltl]